MQKGFFIVGRYFQKTYYALLLRSTMKVSIESLQLAFLKSMVWQLELLSTILVILILINPYQIMIWVPAIIEQVDRVVSYQQIKRIHYFLLWHSLVWMYSFGLMIYHQMLTWIPSLIVLINLKDVLLLLFYYYWALILLDSTNLCRSLLLLLLSCLLNMLPSRLLLYFTHLLLSSPYLPLGLFSSSLYLFSSFSPLLLHNILLLLNFSL